MLYHPAQHLLARSTKVTKQKYNFAISTLQSLKKGLYLPPEKPKIRDGNILPHTCLPC